MAGYATADELLPNQGIALDVRPRPNLVNMREAKSFADLETSTRVVNT